MKRGAYFVALLISLVSLLPGRARGADGPPATAPSDDRKAVIIQLQGHIDDYNRDALFRRFDEARQLGAKVIILDIDTYGGLVLDGTEISRYIKRQDDLHVIAFVKDKAISAGAMIAMACDEIVVSDDAAVGDCAPIMIGPDGLQSLGATERAKLEAPVLADFADSAQRNHHDLLLAAGMVDMTRVIYWVQNKQGEKKFVDEKEHTDLLATKDWTDVPGVPVPIKTNTSLLLLDSKQALDYGIASGKAASAMALANSRNYNVVGDLTPGNGEKLVDFLNGSLVRGLLLVVFLLSLYMVVHAPGHGLGETVGVIALGLMLGVPMLTGYAQWWEILIIFLGLGLIAFEILLPGHIIPGVLGAIFVLVGLVMTFVPKEPGGMPFGGNLNYAVLSLRTGLLVVAGGLGSSLFLWFWINRFLPKMPYVNRLILTATSGGTPLKAGNVTSPSAATWPPIGGIGRAVSELKPGGSAEFYDSTIANRRMASVVSESGFLPAGTEIVVSEVAGSRVVVRRKD